RSHRPAGCCASARCPRILEHLCLTCRRDSGLRINLPVESDGTNRNALCSSDDGRLGYQSGGSIMSRCLLLWGIVIVATLSVRAEEGGDPYRWLEDVTAAS